MNRPGTNRRGFLRSALSAGAFVAASGGGLRAGAFVESKSERRFAPMRVSRERLIRTVVGLRPYRAEGFVVKAERVGEKLVATITGTGAWA